MASGLARPIMVSVSSDSRSTVGIGPSWARVRSAAWPCAKDGKRQPS